MRAVRKHSPEDFVMRSMRTIARCGLLVVATSARLAAQQPDTTAHRYPVLAGGLSYLFPGVGSLYAGNSKHALVHAGVAVASFVAFAEASGAKACSSACATVGLTGLFTFAVNEVWSIVTAAKDANTFNRHHHPADSMMGRGSPYSIGRVHLGLGGGVSPYLRDATGGHTAEVRFGISFRGLPDWTAVWATSSVVNDHGTDEYRRVCSFATTCAPRVAVETGAFEVQRRWGRERRIHPLASVAVGELRTAYKYSGPAGFRYQDSVQTRRFVAMGGGIEARVFPWIHGALIGGYRATSGSTIPHATSSNSGPTLAWLVEIGRP
jgi:hypothetical protein